MIIPISLTFIDGTKIILTGANFKSAANIDFYKIHNVVNSVFYTVVTFLKLSHVVFEI